MHAESEIGPSASIRVDGLGPLTRDGVSWHNRFVVHDLDRIEHLLAEKKLDPQLFERCAQDLLGEIYPGLVPIPGGSDWGRDADVHVASESVPYRLIATTSRKLESIRQNLLRGIASMKKHTVAIDRLALANPADLNLLQRNKLAEVARREGARLDVSDIYDRGFFSSKLRRDGHWRRQLLGLSSNPISLSYVPRELAESPWTDLPLLGRESDLASLWDSIGDLIVTGPPGVGKSRLLKEFAEVVFVDADASLEQVSDDVRWLTPKLLAIDDAGQARGMIRHLLRLRSAESDIFNFRIFALCWPEEVERVSSWLQCSSVHSVELLERSLLDELLHSIGITGDIARSEILDQAEGRPGWAVALGSMLLRARDGSSLLNGAALYGEVTRYLYRTGMNRETVDVLAVVCALGGISSTEVGDVAEAMGLPRTSVAGLLNDVARSGLLDTQSGHTGQRAREEGRFQVRPPMLAKALVAERLFRTPIPVLDMDGLLKRWPERVPALAEAAIGAARVGAADARQLAGTLFARVVALRDVDSRTKLRLADSYARVDRAAGQEVLALTREELRNINSHSPEPHVREPLLEILSKMARWYLFPGAVELLLDAAIFDSRPTHSHPHHPLRLLEDLVHTFHPELPPPQKQRDLVAKVVCKWIDMNESDQAWIVYGAEVENILDLHLHSIHPAPGDPRSIQLGDAIVSPSETRRIYQEIWPVLKEKLASGATPSALRSAITAAGEWMSIGAGFDQSFGKRHPEETIKAVRQSAEQLVDDLEDLVSSSPGLVAYLRDLAEGCGVHTNVDIEDEKHESGAFFVNVERHEDWRNSVQAVRQSIAETTEPWAREPPPEVVRRLRALREQLQLASITWPDRILLACEAISCKVPSPLDWVDAALELKLFPEAGPFLVRVSELNQEIGPERLTRLLNDRHARWSTLETVLLRGRDTDRSLVVKSISVEDYQQLRLLFLTASVPDSVAKELLISTDDASRGAVAAAMFGQRQDEREEWVPAHLDDWRRAIEVLDMSAIPGLRDYECRELTEYLARRWPSSLVAIVERALRRSQESKDYVRILPHGSWEALHYLPHDAKDQILARFAENSGNRWLLLHHLVGTDVDWLAHALEKGLVTPDEALLSYTGFGPHPTIEQFAELLVPQGVDPGRIALLAMSGGWTGEESNHYRALVSQFEKYANSDRESILAVGLAGVEIYKAAQNRAEKEERTRRVRGEL